MLTVRRHAGVADGGRSCSCYGAEIMKVAAEGKISEVSYKFPRPGPDKTPVQKVAYVTRGGDQVCLVGYYT
jgi:hypothetical protein